MTFLVELHMCGGSMGEAVPPIEVVHVTTKQEAQAVADMVHNHSANKYDNLWTVITEVPILVASEADAVKQMLSNYYFEDYEDEDE